MRNDAVAVGKKRAGLYSVATFVENIHRRLNEGGGHIRVEDRSERKRFDGSMEKPDRSVFGVGEIT